MRILRRLGFWSAAGVTLGVAAGGGLGVFVGLGLNSGSEADFAAAVFGGLVGGVLGVGMGLAAGVAVALIGALFPRETLLGVGGRVLPAVVAASTVFAIGAWLEPFSAALPAGLAALAGALAGPGVERRIGEIGE